MLSGLIAGILAGLAMFLLFLISDVLFFSKHGEFKASRHYESNARRAAILLAIAVVHFGVLGAIFGLFREGIPGVTLVGKGLLFGFAAALILSRQSVEALFFFDEEYVPRRYAYYWLIEYLVGYTMGGGLTGALYNIA
ncbi:MAG: hypothetical protein C4521_12095 [Actinobacteria bacterium]|jgi:hypothetical protein|nr:MAG: hypothetical protein C4521_12095 [Actinomycetota bacterium]